MSKKLKFIASLVALLFCLTGIAFGQEQTGAIEGTIKDPAGNVVPGVTITVSSSGTTSGARQDATVGFNRTATTDDSGFFRILEVPSGFFNVSAAATSGFGAATVEQVEVVLGKTTPVNFALGASGVSGNVTITASDVQAIDQTDSKIQTNITAQTAELLPKGVNFTSLLTVAPAVRAEPASGQFQIDGASGSENTFIIDGQEVSNFRTGSLNANNNIPFQFVQEVQVKSSGFEAEFGGATGGVVNVVTRGGSNDFHGEFGISFRPSRFTAAARQFLTNAFPGAPRYVQPRKDGGTDVFPSGTFSGPILKDRVWFLASVTPQYRHIVRDVTYINPATSATVGAGRFRQDQTNNYDFLRIDASLRNNLRFQGSYTYNPITLRGIAPLFGDELLGVPSLQFGANDIRSGEDFLNNRGGRQNSQNVTGGFVFTPTSNLVATVRGGYSFLNEKLDSYGVPSVVGITRFACSTSSVLPIPAEANCSRGTQTAPAIQQLLFDVSRRKTLDADASYFLNNFGGRHQFKGGYQLNALSNNVFLKTIDQVVLYYGLSINNRTGIGAGDLPPTPGQIGSGLLQRFARQGSAASRNDAFYVQDSYQPFNRLSINVGVRTEAEDVPSFIAGKPSIKFDYADKIAPRFGLAFDLTGDGKTKLFASYGRFFDRFKYELPRGSFGGEFYRRDYFEIFPGGGAFNSATYSVGNILRGQSDPAGGICPIAGQPRGATRCQFDFRIASNAGLGIENGAIDPDIKPFRQSEYTVGAERDLGSGFLFRGRFTHKNVDRAVEDIGFSSASGSEAYIIGNPGEGLAAQVGTDFGFVPLKAVRRYNALELNLDKRFTKSYYFNANYTYSRLVGNYSGLASSDEAGRLSPNVNRYFDLPFIGFTAQGVPDTGRLSTDRPHVFKFYGAYSVNTGRNNTTEFSGFTTAQSGTPLTTRFTFFNIDNQILNGRGDLGRTEMFTQTDFAVRHKYRFGSNEKYSMVFDLDILNLFNESNTLAVFENINPGINVGATALGLTSTPLAEARFQRTPTVSQINSFIAANGGNDARFGQATTFQTGRTVRFGFRLLF